MGRLAADPVTVEIVPASPTHVALKDLLKQRAALRSGEPPGPLGEKVRRLRDNDVEAEFLTMLRDRGYNPKWPVAWALGVVRSRAAVPDLLGIVGVNRRGVGVRQHVAAEALGLIGDARATKALCGLLERAYTRRARLCVILSLRRLRDENALATLRKTVQVQDGVVSGAALAAIQTISGEDLAAKLVQTIVERGRSSVGTRESHQLIGMAEVAADALLGAFDRERSAKGVRFLGKYLRGIFRKGSERGRIGAAFARKLRSQDAAVCAEALQIVAWTMTPQLVQEVLPLLSHPSPGVRYHAAWALRSAKAERARGPLLRMLRNHTQWCDRAAIEPLLSYGDAGIDQAVIDEFRWGDRLFRLAVVDKYSKMRPERARKWLRGVAGRDRDRKVQDAARRALRRISE
ncbi:MAG: HEAT repeat domain-containing protein [Planctomycetota bacterium]